MEIPVSSIVGASKMSEESPNDGKTLADIAARLRSIKVLCEHFPPHALYQAALWGCADDLRVHNTSI